MTLLYIYIYIYIYTYTHTHTHTYINTMYISPQHAMVFAVHFVTLPSNAMLTSVTHYDIHFETMEENGSFLHIRIQSVINFKMNCMYT
jgi:hypothetical protein